MLYSNHIYTYIEFTNKEIKNYNIDKKTLITFTYTVYINYYLGKDVFRNLSFYLSINNYLLSWHKYLNSKAMRESEIERERERERACECYLNISFSISFNGISSHTPVRRSHPLSSHAGVRSVRIAQPPEHFGEAGTALWSRAKKRGEKRNESARRWGNVLKLFSVLKQSASCNICFRAFSREWRLCLWHRVGAAASGFTSAGPIIDSGVGPAAMTRGWIRHEIARWRGVCGPPSLECFRRGSCRRCRALRVHPRRWGRPTAARKCAFDS